MGNPGEVYFHPSNGQLCPPWPLQLPPEHVPKVIVLPGCHWDIERGEEELARVRWAPQRPVIWLPAGQAVFE